jgi:hypothetical protein
VSEREKRDDDEAIIIGINELERTVKQRKTWRSQEETGHKKRR